MDLISILATVILVTTIGTTVAGVGAYAAFKLRDKRRPKAKRDNDEASGKINSEPVFLKRYVPPAQITKVPSEQ